MGKYEEAKARRWSEPGPAPLSRSESMRKWSGGLMPGGPMGSYCPPPVNTLPSPPPASSQHRQRNKKVKTYSAYSVSRSVHRTKLILI